MTARTPEEIIKGQDDKLPSPYLKIEITDKRCICGALLVRLGFSYGCTECRRLYHYENGNLLQEPQS